MQYYFEIEPLANGAHKNQICDFALALEGWIGVPKHLETAFEQANPFFDAVIENGVVTAIIKREPPETPENTLQETTENLTLDMLADHEYRLSLLELGIE